MDINRTKVYYEQINNQDLCQCIYCKNYVNKIKETYPKVTEYLLSIGVDIEKPFETMPLEPEKTGYIDYISAQYIIFGNNENFTPAVIDSVNVDIADSHPATMLEEKHFVIEIYPVRLKWTI